MFALLLQNFFLKVNKICNNLHKSEEMFKFYKTNWELR